MNAPMRYDGRLMLIDDVEYTVVGVTTSVATLLGPDGVERVISQDEFRAAISSGRVSDPGETVGLRLLSPDEANEQRFRQKVLLRMDQHRRAGFKVEVACATVDELLLVSWTRR